MVGRSPRTIDKYIKKIKGTDEVAKAENKPNI